MIIGTCAICREERQLTKEHIPPKSAFNDRLVEVHKFQVTNNGMVPSPRGKKFQAGYHRPTLCQGCNNFTGSEYGAAYKKLAIQAASVLSHGILPGSMIDLTFSQISPLRILKQVASMFLSTLQSPVAAGCTELQKFVLDKHQRFLSDYYTFEMNIVSNPGGRSVAFMTEIDTNTGKTQMFSKVAWIPLEFKMILMKDHSYMISQNDITHFANFTLDDVKDIRLHTKIVQCTNAFAG